VLRRPRDENFIFFACLGRSRPIHFAQVASLARKLPLLGTLRLVGEKKEQDPLRNVTLEGGWLDA
jgi:hypothetical protein